MKSWGFVRSKIKTTLYLLFGFVAFSLFQNCGYVGQSEPEKFMMDLDSFSSIPTYSELYTSIFLPKCMSCHSAVAPNFGNYNSLMTSGSVIPFQPNSSSTYTQVESDEMPQGGPPLSSAEKRAISAWIAAGALNDTPALDVAPDAPASVAATAGSSTSIILSWILPTQTVTAVKIERSATGSNPFTVIANLSTAQTHYTDTGLAVATTYYYRVSVSNDLGSSPASEVVNATTSMLPPAAPSAPTTLTAVAVSSSQINLTWTDTSNNETGFKVERATNSSGPFTAITTTAADVTSYSSLGLNASTTYYYRVSAENSAGSSAVTAVKDATTPAAAATAPVAPSDLIATATSSSQINLIWTDNSNNETGFKIERATSFSGPYVLVATAHAETMSYSDEGLMPSTSYFYRVSATNAAGTSSTTAPVAATTQGMPVQTAPSAPSALTAATASSTQINLSWSDNSNNETGFKIERATNSGGPFTLVSTAAANSSSYSSTGLTASTTYYFRVSSVNSVGSSSPTAVVSAMTSAAPVSQATFTWIKTNVVDTKCLACHGSVALGGYDFRTYAGVMTAVVVSDSANSIFYTEINSGSMPQGSSKLSAATITNIKNWIDNGAANN